MYLENGKTETRVAIRDSDDGADTGMIHTSIYITSDEGVRQTVFNGNSRIDSGHEETETIETAVIAW